MDEQQIYERAQRLELQWWKGANFTPNTEWGYYDAVFAPYYPKEPAENVADVGSGPVPILCNPKIKYVNGYAVDPLILEYTKLRKYDRFLTSPFHTLTGFGQKYDNFFDVVFCLNTLDHVQDPPDLLNEIARVIRPGGLFFLFVDIGKPPDQMHPHTIDLEFLHGMLPLWYDNQEIVIKKSWKFPNDTFYYVGRLR